jgi:virginiamycin B lyase
VVHVPDRQRDWPYHTVGVIAMYPVPTSQSGLAGITNGPDGALWFTEQYARKVGRITRVG